MRNVIQLYSLKWMSSAGIALAMFLSLAGISPAEQSLHGPVKYEVKERYGKDNKYRGTFTAKEKIAIIRLQNGEGRTYRPDLLEFSLNGEVLLREGSYEHPLLVCFATLQPENTYEIAVKDFTPAGFKRPPVSPRNIVVSVLPASLKMTNAVFGIYAWEELKDYVDLIQRIKTPGSAELAIAAANLQNEISVRKDSLRRLSDLKDPTARDFFLYLANDTLEKPGVRGEAILALGFLHDSKMIPALVQALLDPEELVRMGAGRALSQFPEQDIQDEFIAAFSRVDSIRNAAVARTFDSIGWRPFTTLLKLAGSSDPGTADTGVMLLTGSGDNRVVEQLLALLEDTGYRNPRLIVAALGATKDSRATAALVRLANDPVKRKGMEGDIGMALGALGDPKSADAIVVMLRKADTLALLMKLNAAYKKLTGKDFEDVPPAGSKGK